MRQSLKQQEKQESIAWLKEHIADGDTVYTILRHVSRSGMQRVVSVVLICGKGTGKTYTLHPNFHVSQALGIRLKRDGNDGLVMGGCGYDAGYQIVHDLSHVLGYKELRHEWL